MSKEYLVNYGTGVGNDKAETLEKAKKLAEENCSYTGESIKIENADGDEVARLPWYGTKAEEDDIVTESFGDYGFYGEWCEA